MRSLMKIYIHNIYWIPLIHIIQEVMWSAGRSLFHASGPTKAIRKYVCCDTLAACMNSIESSDEILINVIVDSS